MHSNSQILKSKISKTFFIFLIASSFIWLLITFSKEYSSTVIYSLSFENIPQNKLLQESPTKELKIKLKGTGFRLFSEKINDKNISLNASKLIFYKNSIYYILLKNQLKNIESHLQSGLEIIEVERDTIFLNLGSLTTKKVPIKPNLDMKFHLGYGLMEPIKLTPDSIVVSGPEKLINSLNKIDLQPFSLKDIKKDFSQDLSILKPKNNEGLKIETTKVNVIGKVAKFTERTIEVPFEIKNVPDSIKLTTLTEKVQVQFIVALSNFNKIDNKPLKIECDYLHSLKNNLNYLNPILIEKPSFIKSYKIVPNKIDFLIRK